MTNVQNVQQRATSPGRSRRSFVQHPPSKGVHAARTNGSQGSVEPGSNALSTGGRTMRARAHTGCPSLRSWPAVPPGGGPAGGSSGGRGGRGRVEAAALVQVRAVSPNAETGEVPWPTEREGQPTDRREP